MTKYEAEIKKQYVHGNNLVTAKQKIAFTLNDTWIYSIHWKNDTWIDQAKVNLQDRLRENAKDLEGLQMAETLLNTIEKEI